MGSLLSHSGHAKNQAKQLLCYEMLVLETTLHESMRSRRHVMVMADGFPMPLSPPAALTQSDGGLDSGLIFPFSAYFSPLQLQAPV